MSDEAYVCNKDPLTADLAKKIAKRMNRRRDQGATAYKCRFCEKWHVANSLTGDLKYAKNSKRRKGWT